MKRDLIKAQNSVPGHQNSVNEGSGFSRREFFKLTGLGLTGYFYSPDPGVPALSAILLALAPWAPWIDRIGPIRRRSPWTRATVRGLAVLLVVGAGVLVAEAGSSQMLEEGSSL